MNKLQAHRWVIVSSIRLSRIREPKTKKAVKNEEKKTFNLLSIAK